MTNKHQLTADAIQGFIDDLEARIPIAESFTRVALEAQLRQQRIALAHVKRKGGIS